MAQRRFLKIACAAILLAAIPDASLRSQQKMDATNLTRAQGMLRDAYDNVKKYYYDPKYHGVDIDARYHDYNGKIQNATSLSHSCCMSGRPSLTNTKDPTLLENGST